MAPCFDCQPLQGGSDARMLSGPFLGPQGRSVYRCIKCGTEWNREAPGAAEVAWDRRPYVPVVRRSKGGSSGERA